MVQNAYTIIDPHTVMIHFQNAFIAFTAMMATIRFKKFAFIAKSLMLLIFPYY